MQRLWSEIDLHVAAMLLMLAPAACLSWWGLAIPLLVPQGRIGTRAFVDYPAFKQWRWAYLAVNEVLVFGTVGLLAGVRFAVASAA
ncbi:hypothetical protein GobsT_67400 [Gemmata obscuriglobus]|uniref:Uncharacterized protein n=1 Tax=Gemmata obscuriglobus TaxID=114 RepID=A0A2Z3GXC3_9BACT|nr:hypothetical protein [Gemmata obscuriglobus]AWM35585.1 hypothetical protein C1280_00140 [Gemmata obscuriglobus]QEG31893.1 hypothetical protein GobsT_67400 [Gemmata obscuriglobus]VTS11239.1 unnamed protein product [Gemmata obscuriglobus UQM 2246]